MHKKKGGGLNKILPGLLVSKTIDVKEKYVCNRRIQFMRTKTNRLFGWEDMKENKKK